jgi:hypothetical protein
MAAEKIGQIDGETLGAPPPPEDRKNPNKWGLKDLNM